jgi:ABC-type glycerol-3-phosphate transport system substrate-binding protein
MIDQSLSNLRALGRRDALMLAGAAAAVVSIPAARSESKLTIWTGYPEIRPVYQAVAAEYTKTHPGVGFDFFSTTLREAEQKLTAAVPTGTGPESMTSVPISVSISLIMG